MNNLATKPNIMVLFGGISSEHTVSCLSASEVINNIDTSRYNIIPVGISRSGDWIMFSEKFHKNTEISLEEQLVNISSKNIDTKKVSFLGSINIYNSDTSDNNTTKIFPKIDAIFPLLHGPFGEDGSIQGFCEMFNIRYIGSGTLASALAMDKHFMKLTLASMGFQISDYIVIRKTDWEKNPQQFSEKLAKLGFPLFVKPSRSGSSMGVSRITSPEDIKEALQNAHIHDPKAIVESEIVGKEVEFAVLQGRKGKKTRVSVPGEITIKSEEEKFYDFSLKYSSNNQVALTIPAQLSEEKTIEGQKIATQIFDSYFFEGLIRVDLFYTKEEKFIVNEINTIPGFTQHSMYPMLWAHSGIDFSDLISELIELALERNTGLR